MKKTLVILGHPNGESFCSALAKAYCEGAKEAGHDVREIAVGALDFDPTLWMGYSKKQDLEPDLIMSQKLIEWAEHIVFVYPSWWGTMPARMKGFIDRVLIPGFAFKYRANSSLWDKLLKGRTAHLIVTMDTPPWYYRWIYRSPGHNQMKRATLGFCGINVVKTTEIASIKSSTPETRAKWLLATRQLGAQS